MSQTNAQQPTLTNAPRTTEQGFTLIETVAAMLTMMVVALGAAGLFLFAVRNNTGASDRARALAIAQEQMEIVRTTSFANLSATFATANTRKLILTDSTGVSRSYSVNLGVEDAPVVNGTARLGLKRVTIDVVASGANAFAGGRVRLVSYRSSARTRRELETHTCRRPRRHTGAQQQMPERVSKESGTAGFSLVELMIAMAVTLVMMGIATTLLAQSLRVRTRENQRSDALSDVQRAVNIMTREIANSGFGLTDNGIVAADSDANSIRFRANLNTYTGAGNRNATSDPGEDIYYSIFINGDASMITRLDVNATNIPDVLANRIDSLQIDYLTVAGVATTPANADRLRIRVGVRLEPVGVPNSPGFHPASVTELVSEVTLRNKNLLAY